VQLTSLGIGAVIGAGIFVSTGVTARQTAGPALMLSYVVAGLVCILSALCYAISQTITRQLGRTDSGAIIVLTATVVTMTIAGAGGLIAGSGHDGAGLHPSVAFLVRSWTMPPWGVLGRMALCGLISAVGIYCLTQAYRVAPASTVSPPEYVMIGGRCRGVVRGTSPACTLLGVATTVAAGLTCFTIRRDPERRRGFSSPAG
jgi:drug/metabolite transporter (DMT)-like permease